MNLNVDEWKEFYLGRLFDIRKGKRLTSADQEEGYNNYIGAIDSNNGVANHIGQAPIHEGNTISLSYNGSVGEAFYQYEPYWATDDVNALYCNYKGFNQYIGLFIATVIRKEKFKYSYGRKWTLENMNTSIIRLPIQHNPEGIPYIDLDCTYSEEGYVPDWQFMEDYIKSLHHKPLTTKNEVGKRIVLKPNGWKEFKIDDLFNVEIAKSADIGNLDEGDTLFIGRTDLNNGVQGLVVPLSVTKGGCITVSMVGTNVALYQENDFQASQNIAVLRYDKISKYNALFICTMINHEMNLKYSYGRTVGKNNIKEMILKLPSDVNGNPDWQFMEDYIKLLPYGDRL